MAGIELSRCHLGTLWQKKQTDEEKKRACKLHKITLIEVPFWWDREATSLAATIQKETENLLVDYVAGECPIPATQDYQEQPTGMFCSLLTTNLLMPARRSTSNARNGMEWN